MSCEQAGRVELQLPSLMGNAKLLSSEGSRRWQCGRQFLKTACEWDFGLLAQLPERLLGAGCGENRTSGFEGEVRHSNEDIDSNNACLGEALRRVKLIRQSKDFVGARSLKASNPERKVLFKQARERYDFSEYALHSYSTHLKHSWLGEHIDSNTAQKLATRAYKAVERVLFGKAKKVRFKGKNQMDSVEGKSNKSGIRWKGQLVEWSGLQLKALITAYDPVILHGLNSKVKYVRLVRRKVSGINRFYAQLVCEGKPFIKPKNHLGQGKVGIDIGPAVRIVLSKWVKYPRTTLG